MLTILPNWLLNCEITEIPSSSSALVYPCRLSAQGGKNVHCDLIGQRTVVKLLADSSDVTLALSKIFHLEGDSDYISVQV